MMTWSEFQRLARMRRRYRQSRDFTQRWPWILLGIVAVPALAVMLDWSKIL